MIPKCFEKYPNKKFKIIAINDIDYTYPHRYKVIFQDTNTNDEFEERLLPEELRGHYVLGNTYSSKGLEFENKNTIRLFVKKSKVSKKSSSKIHEHIIFPNELGIEKTNSFYNQNCFIYQTKRYIYLIPHYVVANRYYFLSTSIKKALSAGKFESLYYHEKYNEKGYMFYNNTLHIDMKATLKDSEVPLISRMITNETSKINFMFFNRISTKFKRKYKDLKNIFVPIMMGFPFEDNEDFTIECSILNIDQSYFNKENNFDKRDVILITNIFGDTIPYNFEKLDYQIYTEENKEEEQSIGEPNKKNIPRRNPLKSGKYTDRKPSNNIKREVKNFRTKNNVDFSEIEINKHEVVQKRTHIVYDKKEDEEVDSSFDKPEEGSNLNNIREVLLGTTISPDQFKITDFTLLVEAFINKYKISEYEISDLIEIENQEDNFSNKFFIDGNKKHPRGFIFGYIKYNDTLINFIEIEHNIYWKKNTWFFISSQEFTETQIQNSLNLYITKGQTHKELLEELNNIGALKLFTTRHDNIDVTSEDSIKSWCENLKIGIRRCSKLKK